MTTTQLAPTDETVLDLSDLDTLDDDRWHTYCTRCYPNPPMPGHLVRTACGRSVLTPVRGGTRKCEPCWQIRDQNPPCRVCGGV